MTDQERAAFAAHAEWLGRLLADGVLILAGPTLGPVNTGIGIFQVPDEETARAIIAENSVASGGFARAELRPQPAGVPPRPRLSNRHDGCSLHGWLGCVRSAGRTRR